MTLSQGQMELLRDYWNTNQHKISKLEQIKPLITIPIHLEAEIQLQNKIEKILEEFENDN